MTASQQRPERRDLGSDYGRLLAQRDRLIAAGVDPDDLLVPLPPPPEYERRAVRLDPDPLYVEPERVERDTESSAELRSGINLIGCLALVLLAVAAGGCIALWMWYAAPRPGPAVSPQPAQLGAPHDSPAPLQRQMDPGGAPHVGLSDSIPHAGTTLGTALEAGWATWCGETATHCRGWDTRYLGAVNSFTHGDEPYGVQVCLLDRPATCTHVLVVSHCACGDRRGLPTVIDLSRPAFRELAPLSRGIVKVSVEGPIPVPVGPTLTLPPTDVAP